MINGLCCLFFNTTIQHVLLMNTYLDPRRLPTSHQARTSTITAILLPVFCHLSPLPTHHYENVTFSASRSQNDIRTFVEHTLEPALCSTERGSPPYCQLPTPELTARFIDNMPTLPSVVLRASRIDRGTSLPHPTT